MRLEKATLNDKDELQALVLRVSEAILKPYFEGDGWTFYLATINPSVESALQDPNFYTVKLLCDGELVGFAAIRDSNYITQLFVEPSKQGKGLGRRLLDDLINSSFADAIELKSSIAAVNFYQNNGFEIVGEEGNHNGIRYVPMKKQLSRQ
ncbi:GNAT family N-acetyltransferase [Vibrio sonorensis]|uniref:GNAT family N-acetyltransferase n=1 Tax=Vibrio sonorensis TaxID=1004316 RepID=UPI0008DB0E10|nr:GNAT family N-acetyltransferase [Vibrio sonorensis]